MVQFDSPELKWQLGQAAKAWGGFLAIEPFEITVEVFAVEGHTIRSDSKVVNILLPYVGDIPRLACREFIEMTRELPSAEMVMNRECWTDRRSLFRIEPVNEKAKRYLDYAVPEPEADEEIPLREQLIELESLRDAGTMIRRLELAAKLRKPTERFCSLFTETNGQKIVCSLTRGFTIFASLLVAERNCNEYLPPMLDSDLFVEVQYEQRPSEYTVRSALWGYLFDLSCSLGIDFVPSPRATVKRPALGIGDLDTAYSVLLSHPMILGKGMAEVLSLYSQATSALDPQVQILFFARAIEYVSRTVLLEQVTKVILPRLRGLEVQKVDANLIAEIVALVEKHWARKKDRDAVTLTVRTCCEANDLAKFAPSFLTELGCITKDSSQREKEQALRKLGASLWATRNTIAHAKANYRPSGNECPEDEMYKFAQCVKLTAQQVVQWYRSVPEIMRIT